MSIQRQMEEIKGNEKRQGINNVINIDKEKIYKVNSSIYL